MSTERRVMQDYLDALVKREDFPAYFTGDVVATFEGAGQRGDGREAAIEAAFMGTHPSDFAGISATGRAVRVPCSVVYNLRGLSSVSRLLT